jgi:hypothetical protein
MEPFWNQEPDEQLAAALLVADRLLTLVVESAPGMTHSRDRNDQILWSALGRAFRCYRSIRDVVADHAEPDDAAILTRALFSLTLRSLWLASPDNALERSRRGRVYTKHEFAEAEKQAREAVSAGLAVEGETAERWRSRADEQGDVGGMPTDVALARSLDLNDLYATMYRSTSGSVHFSLLTALGGFVMPAEDDASLSGAKIRFEEGDASRAAYALFSATLVFVEFLHRSGDILGHTLGGAATQVMDDVFGSDAD